MDETVYNRHGRNIHNRDFTQLFDNQTPLFFAIILVMS